MKTAQKILAATVLTAGMITTVNAQALNSCAATFTVAAAYLSTQNLNRDADDVAELSVKARRAATRQNWGGNAEISTRMYRDALRMKQIRFANQPDSLSADIRECTAVLVQAGVK